MFEAGKIPFRNASRSQYPERKSNRAQKQSGALLRGDWNWYNRYEGTMESY